MSTSYVPINCEFHDVLEAAAVRRRVVAIHHLDPAGQPTIVDARIDDLHAKDGEEYMRLDDGRLIRLDQVLGVDGIERSAFEDACAVPAW